MTDATVMADYLGWCLSQISMRLKNKFHSDENSYYFIILSGLNSPVKLTKIRNISEKLDWIALYVPMPLFAWMPSWIFASKQESGGISSRLFSTERNLIRKKASSIFSAYPLNCTLLKGLPYRPSLLVVENWGWELKLAVKMALPRSKK